MISVKLKLSLSFFLSVLGLSLCSNVNAQEFEQTYNPFTGQTSSDVYYNSGRYHQNGYVYGNRYVVTGVEKDPYSFCYHNGKAYSEGSKVKRRKCVKSGFPNSPMSWEDVE
ncbi:MAG: hypothetical protein RLZZ210_999 [Pseudomonadota bacterium]|jgi:hypothetical protein